MQFVGIDLHKQVIAVLRCRSKANGAAPQAFLHPAAGRIGSVPGDFGAVSRRRRSHGYHWLGERLEPLADRIVLAHPKKLRVIAESTRKNDKIDAQVLAEFLALEMIPEAFRPGPRQRQHRALVRHRHKVQGRITSLRCRIRHVLSNYNADRSNLFTVEGREYARTVAVSEADRFVLDELFEEWEQQLQRLRRAEQRLRQFAQQAPVAEAEARALLDSIPCVGTVTIDVLLSELGDVRRFRSQKRVVAYAGLAPGVRESAGKRKDLHISKEGSRLLRWALVEPSG
jgi:transposase